MMVGYARVSTVEQETDLQVDGLKRAGVSCIFMEKASSVGKRPQLRLAISALQPGDVLVVYKLDRLARSLKDLLLLIEQLGAAHAGFRSLTESIDTSTPAGMLMVHMLGAVAQFERSLIRERSMAGQRAARERGAHCGRPRSLDEQAEAELVRMYRSGGYTMHALATAFGLHPASVKRAIYRKTRPGHSSLA